MCTHTHTNTHRHTYNHQNIILKPFSYPKQRIGTYFYFCSLGICEQEDTKIFHFTANVEESYTWGIHFATEFKNVLTFLYNLFFSYLLSFRSDKCPVSYQEGSMIRCCVAVSFQIETFHSAETLLRIESKQIKKASGSPWN